MTIDITAIKFDIEPDFRYNSFVFAKLINKIMKSGKKSIAEKIVYGAFEKVFQDISTGAVDVKISGSIYKPDSVINLLDSVLQKSMIGIEVVTKRVGGSNYKIPKPISPKRSLSIAFSWIAQSLESRSEKTAIEKLSAEVLDILNDRGFTIKKKTEIEKNAEANRAFAHLLTRKS